MLFDAGRGIVGHLDHLVRFALHEQLGTTGNATTRNNSMDYYTFSIDVRLPKRTKGELVMAKMNFILLLFSPNIPSRMQHQRQRCLKRDECQLICGTA